MNNLEEIAETIGQLVAEKNAAYGSSFAKAGGFLRLLYPHGLQPDQYADALLLVRIFDKQMRIATDRDALGESPYQDIAGYGILGVHMHHEHKEQQALCPDTASAAADTSSVASPCASAAPRASQPTTQNESATHESAPSKPPRNFFGRLDLANASDATEVASANAADLANPDRPGMATTLSQMRARSSVMHCAACGRFEGDTIIPWLVAVVPSLEEPGEFLRICSVRCREYCCAFREPLVDDTRIPYGDLLLRSNVMNCSICSKGDHTTKSWIWQPISTRLGKIELRCCSRHCAEVLDKLNDQKQISFVETQVNA